MLTRFFSALRRFWYPFTVQAEVRKYLASRGELADAPMVYIPPSFYDRLCALEAELADIPTFEQLAALYLIPTKENR